MMMAEYRGIETGSKILPTAVLARPEQSGQILQPRALEPADLSYSSGSSPPGYAYAADDHTIPGGGIITVDLTSMTDVEGIAVDGTNMKLQEMRVQCSSTNSNDVVIARGASNPYEAFGADLSDVGIAIPPGGLFHMRFNDQLADISNTAKNVEFNGTQDDEFDAEWIVG